MKRSFALVGPGRLGPAVARLLVAGGYELRAVIGRDQERAAKAAAFAGCPNAGTTDPGRAHGAELILLAVPDDHLAAAARHLNEQGHIGRETVLVHFSGLHPASILEAGPHPVRALALHPLQTFADPAAGAAHLPGTPVSVEGPEGLLPLGEELAHDLGGRPFRIAAEQKALYHAAACIASNYLVTLVAAASDLLAACGLEEEVPHRLLAPLLQGTLNNLNAAETPEKALTGPIARHDAGTVARHLDALQEQAPDYRELYRTLGRMTMALAEGPSPPDEESERWLLSLLETVL